MHWPPELQMLQLAGGAGDVEQQRPPMQRAPPLRQLPSARHGAPVPWLTSVERRHAP